MNIESFNLKNIFGENLAIWQLYEKIVQLEEFHFSPAEASQISLIHGWLQQDHIKEWIHGVGLQNTLNGLEKFFREESDTTYWIGYHKGAPFAFLITSPEGPDATTLDLFICDLNYLGKGLAVPMIREFLISHFSKVKKVLIDPEASNERAIHVYQKAGFKIIGEFIASWHPVPHYQMELYMKGLVNPKKEIGA
jgi:RimJ/RimL family protein N-acetyltransferase